MLPIYAHRGWHGPGAPENSRSAIAYAASVGIGVEIDLRLTADGEPVVFHDEDLARLTGAPGTVETTPWGELAGLPLGGTAETVPHLQDALRATRSKVPLLLELKAKKDVLPLARTILERYRDRLPSVSLMSFDPGLLSLGKEAGVPLGFVSSARASETARNRQTMARLLLGTTPPPDFVAFSIDDLTPDIARGLKDRGIPLRAWTVKTRPQLEKARALGAEPIAEDPALGELTARR